jgi:hypothetical protein
MVPSHESTLKQAEFVAVMRSYQNRFKLPIMMCTVLFNNVPLPVDE